MKPISNIIFGLKSFALEKEEADFFREINPLGFILFKRNIDTPSQLGDLIASLKELVDHDSCLILIDQEGGRVARLQPPYFRKTYPAKVYGDLALKDFKSAQEAVYINHLLMGRELQELGINCNCAPVADLFYEEADSIIGDRSFGFDIEIVSTLAKIADLGLRDGGVQSIIKHIPGHGRADQDSHHALPIVRTPLQILEKIDFNVFMELRELKFAMTAHILFTSLDSQSPITTSKISIDYIRNRINFSGLLITDDLSMKALGNDIAENTKLAIKAGCDILLHCNGSLDEMRLVAQNSIYLIEEQLNNILQLNCFLKGLSSNKKLYDKSNVELELMLEDLLQKGNL